MDANYPCGCRRLHPDFHCDSCLVHDETGKRWDIYTAEEVAAAECVEIDAQTETTEWNCYCGDHPNDLMPIGMKCVWTKSDYESQDMECDCLESRRREWVSVQTSDWIAMSLETKESG